MTFYKLQATGNDFILLIDENINNLDIKQLCNRNFAIGADGVITIDSYYNVKIYNQDGSEAKMCGNGMRCVSKLLSYLTNKNENSVYLNNTKVDLIQLDDNNAKVSMPYPMMVSFENGYYVSLLNYHYVLLTNSLNDFKFDEHLFELSNKNKCNIHIVEILNKNEIKMKSYEYGVGFTKSCGSGSLASFYALFMLDKVNDKIKVIQEGGTLNCMYDNNQFYLCGEVKLIYKGETYEI